MACTHKFLGIHKHNSLLPDWHYDTLILGTFNPSWIFSKGQNASYFYGRTRNNYFWDVLPEVFQYKKLRKESKVEWIQFLKKYKIGITDLLISINDAQANSKIHWELVRTKADVNLAKFKKIHWNTNSIIEAIDKDQIKYIYITNLTSPSIFELEIEKINNAALKKNIILKRLVTPSLMCRFYFKNRNGLKLYDCLLEKWKTEFHNEV